MAWSTLEDTQLSFHDPREKAIPVIGLNPTSLVATAQRLSEYLQSPADTRGKFVNLGSGNEYLASNVVQALKEALRSLDGARTQAYGAETGRGQVSFEQFVMRFARGKNDFNELALAICNGINQLVNSGIFVVSPEQEFMAQAGRIQQERIKELQAEMAAKENLLTDQAQKTGAFADQMEKVRQFHLDRILKEGKPLAPSDQSQLIQEVSQGIEEYKIEVGKEVRELIETQEREIQKYVSATAKSHQIVDVQQQVALEKLCKEAVALASQQKASGTKIDISSLNSEVVSNAQLRNVVHGRELAELNSVVNSIFEKVDPRTTVTAKNIQDKARKATAGAVRQALVKESVGNIGKQQNLAPETQLRAIGIASAQELAVRSLGENLAAVVGSAYERAAAQSLKGEAINIDPALRAYIGEAKAKNLQIQVQQALDGAGREGANLFLQASSGVDNDPNIAASHAILRDNISALAARDNINPTVVAAASALTNLNLEASRRIITEVEAVATTPLAPDIQTKIKDLYLRASDMAVSQVAKGGRSIDLSDLVKEAKNDPVLRSHLTDAHFQSIQDAVVKTYIDADNAPIILIDRARSRVPTDIGAKIESVSQKRVERFYQPDLNIYKQVRNSLVKQAAEVEKLTTRYTQDPKTAAAVKEIYAGGMELAAKQISTGKAVDLSALKNSVDEGSPLSAYVRSEQIASLEDIAKKTYINPDIAAEVIQINDLASVTAGLDKQVAVVSALTTSAITELPGFKTLRESATSPEVVEQIQRLNESLVDVTTRQAAAGYEKLDLQDIYEQVSLQKVGEYVSPQYLAKATEEMQKLFDDPAFRQQALAVVNARQMLAPDIASVYEVFEGLVDPRGILSPEIRAQRALEASYKFAKASREWLPA
jgi:hypothetical protein